MKFNEIVALLNKPLTLGTKQADRVKRLADIVTEEVDHADEFHAALGGDTVLAKYASGNRPIKADFATAITGGEHGSYYPGGLIDRIDGLEDKVRQSLVDQVKPEFPSASIDNIGEVITGALTDALTAVITDPVVKGTAVQAQREASTRAVRNRLLPLLMQSAGDFCQMPGCSRTLYGENDTGEKIPMCTAKMVDPDGDEADLQNLVAMCPDCAPKYTGNDPATRAALQAAKQQAEDRQQAHAQLIPTGLEPQIREVVASVASLPPATQVTSENWNAYEVRRKITQAHMLAHKVESYVAGYFDFIENTTQGLDQQGTLNFGRVQRAFGSQYDRLADTGQGQEQVFDAMVDWLMTATSGQRTPCEALVSYFVQLCEVFRATA